MPAKSVAQQRLMAMAEHNPGAVKDKNKGVLAMSKSQLHDFASTKGLDDDDDIVTKRKRKQKADAERVVREK